MARRKTTSPPPAYRDAAFMESLAARPVRILTEYIDPLVRMRREGVGDTIVIFGSARIGPVDVCAAAGRLAPSQASASRACETKRPGRVSPILGVMAVASWPSVR